MAQSAYLKATAKLNVAERAFRRAELLLKEKSSAWPSCSDAKEKC